ncbi:MAG TPA: hypothetical protein ENI62_15010 [Gammaproteobacteria bacterium]|nr:hypothetical protein [Gammaproteobacteria bacterium]
MKCLLASLAIIAGFGIAHASGTTVSLDDIVMLSQRDVSDKTILVLLQNREIGFVLDADDIDNLLEAGVSEEVIRYLLQNTTSTPPDTNAGTPRYIYPPIAYVDPYPAYYYRPYYAGTSLYFGYSSFPHTSYRYRHHGTEHYKQSHHSAPSHLAHNGHDRRVAHTGGHDPGHIITGAQYNIARAGHSETTHISHSRGDAGHGKTASIGHGSRGVGHSRSISFGHRGGHSSNGGHSGGGGHGGGGHGGGH